FHLAASSPSIKYVDNWQTTQMTTRSVLRVNGTVILPSLGKKYIMTNGILQRARRMPSAGRVLQPVTGLIQWETVTPADYSA
ncbi:phage tail fiber protein, partial [Klebsiella pneumoniae]